MHSMHVQKNAKKVLYLQNEPITQVPQVSKQPIDLHRLYLAVRQRGGFEQVIDFLLFHLLKNFW